MEIKEKELDPIKINGIIKFNNKIKKINSLSATDTLVSNPYTLQNISLNHSVSTKLEIETYRSFIVDRSLLKDQFGLSFSQSISGTFDVKNLLPENSKSGDYIFKLYLDPNYYVEDGHNSISFGSVQATLSLNGTTVLTTDPFNTYDEVYPTATCYIKANSESTLSIEEITPLVSGWTYDGTLDLGGTTDDDPPVPNAVKIVFLAAVYTDYDPTIKEEDVTIDYDFTK